MFLINAGNLLLLTNVHGNVAFAQSLDDPFAEDQIRAAAENGRDKAAKRRDLTCQSLRLRTAGEGRRFRDSDGQECRESPANKLKNDARHVH